jgi:hypothetical protein
MRALEARLTSPVGFAAVIAGAILVWVMVFTAATSANGNNGTVKIHDGSGEPSPEVRNEPKVCNNFHMDFFFGDPEQAGGWWIEATGTGESAAGGSYFDADGDGRASADAFLPQGHYKLFWEGDGGNRFKHKTFWVHDCDGGGGGGGAG